MTKRLSSPARSPQKSAPTVAAQLPTKTALWIFVLKIAVILAAGFFIYGPALPGDWLLDDVNNITQNTLLRDTTGLWKIWFVPGSFIEYYPLEQSVEWIEWHLFGNDTLGYHFLNLALHLVNALLVWRLLAKLQLRLAWLGGLLFAVHPAMVESVAWISELKNTLSLAPFLLALIAWLDYQRHRRSRDYVLVLAFFLVAMLCKISMAPFPIVILLHAWWRRGRIAWSDLKASLPFFAISFALGELSLHVGSWFQQHNMVLEPVLMGGLFSRLACAGLTLSQYLFTSLCPFDPMPVYPRWNIDPPSLLQFLPWPISIVFLTWFWRRRQSWGRHVLMGLGFFVLNLLPFLGFKAVSYMSFTWVMDHFLYLPILGLIALAVAALEQIDRRLGPSRAPIWMTLTSLLTLLLVWKSHGYAQAFRGEKALAIEAIKHNPGAWTAHNNLGVALNKSRNFQGAIDQFSRALTWKPDFAPARYNLGNSLLSTGHFGEAISQYQQVLQLQPNYPKAHNNMAVALAQMHRLPEAIEQFQAELQLYPHDTATQANLAQMMKLEAGIPSPHQ